MADLSLYIRQSHAERDLAQVESSPQLRSGTKPMREPYTDPGTLTTSYFDRMYEKSDDPWGFASRWYERRKYSLTIAALPRPHYARAFEAGCSIGVLTVELAARCGQLLAVDASADAVRQATARTAHLSHVTVEQRRLPEQWPSGSFDLVILSEIGYYFGAADLAAVIESCVASLTPGGTLLAAHWRHPFADYPLGGDEVQTRSPSIQAWSALSVTKKRTSGSTAFSAFRRRRCRSPKPRSGRVAQPIDRMGIDRVGNDWVGIDWVGVVVPAHDEEAYLPACLDALSIAAGTLKVVVDIVVVLDACADASREAARACRTVEIDTHNVGAARRPDSPRCSRGDRPAC